MSQHRMSSADRVPYPKYVKILGAGALAITVVAVGVLAFGPDAADAKGRSPQRNSSMFQLDCTMNHDTYEVKCNGRGKPTATPSATATPTTSPSSTPTPTPTTPKPSTSTTPPAPTGTTNAPGITPKPTPTATATPTPVPTTPAPTTPAPTTPPAPPAPPAPPPPAGPVAPGSTYRVIGNDLYDPSGTKFRPVGVEQMFWRSYADSNGEGWLSTKFLTEIGKTGANTVRFMPFYAGPTPDGQPAATLADIERGIKAAINAKMFVEIGINHGTDINVYLRDDVKALLFKYQKYIALHASGEAYQDDAGVWQTNTISIVQKLRAAGYTVPLYVMSNAGGRNLPTILNRCQAVLSADPLHNTVFGWQAYWGTNYTDGVNGAYQGLYGMSLQQGFQKAAASPCAIQAGVVRHTEQGGDPKLVLNLPQVMDYAKANDIGWLYWDWKMSMDQVSGSGYFGDWYTYSDYGGFNGKLVADRIASDSIRTPWQQALVV